MPAVTRDGDATTTGHGCNTENMGLVLKKYGA